MSEPARLLDVVTRQNADNDRTLCDLWCGIIENKTDFSPRREIFADRLEEVYPQFADAANFIRQSVAADTSYSPDKKYLDISPPKFLHADLTPLETFYAKINTNGTGSLISAEKLTYENVSSDEYRPVFETFQDGRYFHFSYDDTRRIRGAQSSLKYPCDIYIVHRYGLPYHVHLSYAQQLASYDYFSYVLQNIAWLSRNVLHKFPIVSVGTTLPKVASLFLSNSFASRHWLAENASGRELLRLMGNRAFYAAVVENVREMSNKDKDSDKEIVRVSRETQLLEQIIFENETALLENAISCALLEFAISQIIQVNFRFSLNIYADFSMDIVYDQYMPYIWRLLHQLRDYNPFIGLFIVATRSWLYEISQAMST